MYSGPFSIKKSDLNIDGKHYNSDGNNKMFKGIIDIIDRVYPEIHP